MTLHHTQWGIIRGVFVFLFFFTMQKYSLYGHISTDPPGRGNKGTKGQKKASR